jgi:hypothetical protein
MKNLRSTQWGYVETALYIVAVILLVNCRRGVFNEPTTIAIVLATATTIFSLRCYTHHRYRDYVFEPMRPEGLPRDTYKFFNSRTPEFMQLRCGLVGDFRLAYTPRPVFVRYFLPPDQRVKGEACDWNGTFSVSFTTYFCDGRLLETAITDDQGQKLSNDSKLWFFMYPAVSTAQLYEHHIQAIDAYEASHGVSAIPVTPSRLAEFAQYGHRLVWWEQGKLPKRLGEPRLPEAEPVLLEAASVRS